MKSPYDILMSKANSEMKSLMRNSNPDFRFKLHQDFHRFTYHINLIKKDYPNATIKEITTIIVNRLRHQDQSYHHFIKHNKSKKQYAIQFILAMDRLLITNFAYEFITDEVLRQINKKTRYKEIDLNRVLHEIHSTILVQHILDITDFTPSFDFRTGDIIEVK